jgi:hypothetical protein
VPDNTQLVLLTGELFDAFSCDVRVTQTQC